MTQQRSRLLAGISPLQLALPLEPPAWLRGPAAAGADRRLTLLHGQPVEYLLRRSRRRTIGFQVDERGLTVSIPTNCPLRETERALQERSGWILARLAEWREYQRRRESRATRWEDGGTLRYLGQALRMHVCDRTEGITRQDTTLHVGLAGPVSPAVLRDQVTVWLRAEATRLFGERLPIFCERLGRAPRRWALTSARTRWGSCTADGVIRLNWRLVHLPIELIDYVIAHEVAHLRELNHSPAFWSTVGELLPGYQAARDRLRTLHATDSA